MKPKKGSAVPRLNETEKQEKWFPLKGIRFGVVKIRDAEIMIEKGKAIDWAFETMPGAQSQGAVAEEPAR